MDNEITLSRNKLALAFLHEQQPQYLIRCAKVRSLSSVFKDGAEPITIAELYRLDIKSTTDMILTAINRTLVFHGSENDISDVAGAMLVDEIVNTYGYLSLPEICYVINKTLTKTKYASLSAADILRWIAEYDIDERLDVIHGNPKYVQPTYTGNEISYDEWMAQISQKAEQGDAEALEILERKKAHEKDRVKNLQMYRLYCETVRSNIRKREKN